MDIQNHKTGAVIVVALKGRMDAGTSKAVEDHLLKLIEGGERKLVVDFAQLDYISSVGLRVLILAQKKSKPLGGIVGVCSLQPAIKQVFDVAGFTQLFKVFPSRDEAVAGMV
jgi:anti-anti-sigma factor